MKDLAPRLLLSAILACLSLHAANNPAIRLNSIGFLPDAPKQATVAVECQRFAIVRADDGSVAYEGTIDGPSLNADTGEQLYSADFTGLRKAGEYRVSVEGLGASAPFRVGSDVYQGAFRTVARAMYLWRCGTAVSGEHGGQRFAHEPCHLKDAWLDFVGGGHERKDGAGGWHDAGDYNKYVVNAGVAVGAMLRAWEDFEPAIRGVALNLPEAGGALPELLAEVKWETDWLLTMQAADGSVFHKLSAREFGPFIPPDQETAERFFSPWSSAATADFVAMLAQASRGFRPYDPAYADVCLAAARRSYEFLSEHPANTRADLKGFKTGTYGTRDEDDRLWATAELWETTGDPDLLHALESRLRAVDARVQPDFDWGSVGNLGVFTYLSSTREGRDPSLLSRAKQHVVEAADSIVETRNGNGYARPLGARYYWGGNGSVARQVMVLHAAYRVLPKAAYRDTAMDALNYLFGRNCYGRSFVTGLGSQPPLHPHDRRSGGDAVEAPWPGYLVGGPHPRATDWRDDQEDYRTNEIAINWNGALIYALASALDNAAWGDSEQLATKAKEPDVVFVPTPNEVVNKMLEMAEIKSDDVVYDLGCGDGRIVVAAAKRYGVKAFGFDIDSERIQESLANVRSNKVEHLVTIRQADIFTLDLTPADIVTLYLLPDLNVRLMPQLARLKPGSRILSHDFRMGNAQPVAVEHVTADEIEDESGDYWQEDHTVYKWLVPWNVGE